MDFANFPRAPTLQVNTSFSLFLFDQQLEKIIIFRTAKWILSLQIVMCVQMLDILIIATAQNRMVI